MVFKLSLIQLFMSDRRQLRDVLICPRERGVVNYIQHQSIIEHNINLPDSVRTTAISPFLY
jgi:hypothetical protein